MNLRSPGTRRTWSLSFAVFAVAVCARAQERDLGEPVATGCPIAASDYGSTIRRLFTSSDGTEMSFSLAIPADFDPNLAHGVALYLHGNDDDQNGQFYPDLGRVPANSQARGLIAGALLSPTTRASDDGTSVVRDWRQNDDLIVEEFLDSDLGGCLTLDRKKVVFAGESDGTCFASHMLTTFLWRKYAGGVLGYCGCWPPQIEYLYPVDPSALRNSFRVFIENTTDGFEYWNGPNGYEHLHYNLGLEVRTDLMRPGGHCENSRINGEAALDWVLGVADYPPEFDFVPYWEQIDLTPNYIDNLVAINADGRVVRIQWEPHLSDDDLELIGEEVRHVENDLTDFYNWRDMTFPEFQDLKPRVFVSDDYGDNWSGGDTLDTLVFDLLAGADGHFYVATRDGVWRDDGTGLGYTPFTLTDQRVDAIEQDDEGTFYAYGAVLSTVRRLKSGETDWTELSATTPVGYLQRERHMLSYSNGVLTMLQDDGTLLYTEDGGDNWNPATLPIEAVDFVHHGRVFYAIDAAGTQLVMSPDAGTTWQPVSLPAASSYIDADLIVTPEGDLLVQASDTSYRSKDQGTSFVREAGLNLLQGADAAFGADGHAIAAGLRGVFRYRAAASSLPDTSGLLTGNEVSPAPSASSTPDMPVPTGTVEVPVVSSTPSTPPEPVEPTSTVIPEPTASSAPSANGPAAPNSMPITSAAPGDTSTAASAASDSPSTAADDAGKDGCGCRLGAPTGEPVSWSLAGLTALFALCARRRDDRH
ncbi:MAG TPA: hypothetical protein VHM70_09465 [Polyangiaceae bacterium]|nr:hypothetical protein [Polyangiaceae bacterium]